MKNLVQRNGRYYFRQMVNGRVVRKSLRTKNYQEAVRKAEALLESLPVESAPQDPSSTSVSDFCGRWLAEFIHQRRNPKNHSHAKQRMDDYVLPFIGSIKLCELKLADLVSLRSELDKTKLSVGTKRYVLGDLRTMLNYAVEMDVLERSPWKKSLMPRQKELAPKGLSDEEVEAILAHTHQEHQLMFRLALLTGCRWGELHSLRWSQVKDLPFPHLLLENTKSGKVRRVPLLPAAQRLLSTHERTKGYVIQWRAAYPGAVVAGVKRRSGVEFHFHQFRHTFATRWLNAGGSKESLQKILGHSTIRLTERYGHMADAAVWNEAEGLAVGM